MRVYLKELHILSGERSSSPWCNGYGYREVTGSISTMGAFFRSPQKTPSTGSSPRKRTRERLYKP
ncbi:hypothetical protein DPMN_087881 [Dreissena polymorpha]|uniref:Uncharacterized protein n=1 Tax=Dreissena polymorpha TaxID=45954 RepID=A0A9D4KT44_DREPO|nr:hypothetical protein DPMN_087881 [Dreissena polymorpha]